MRLLKHSYWTKVQPYWTKVQLQFRSKRKIVKTVTIKLTGVNNARDFDRGDCGRCIQHNDDCQNDRRQRGSLCQRRLSSRLRRASSARCGRTSRRRRMPLCYREWRTGSSLRIKAKIKLPKNHKSTFARQSGHRLNCRYVCFWPKADMSLCAAHVRFWE